MSWTELLWNDATLPNFSSVLMTQLLNSKYSDASSYQYQNRSTLITLDNQRNLSVTLTK